MRLLLKLIVNNFNSSYRLVKRAQNRRRKHYNCAS